MIKNAKICQIYLSKVLQKNNYCAPARMTGVFSQLVRTTSFGSVTRSYSSTPKIPLSLEKEIRAELASHYPHLPILTREVSKTDNTAIVTFKPPKDYSENKFEALKNTVERYWVKNSDTFLTAHFVPHKEYKKTLEQVLDEHKRKFLKDSPSGNIRSVSLGSNVVKHLTEQNIPSTAILFEYLQMFTLSQMYFLNRMCFFFQTEGGTYEISWFSNPTMLRNTDLFLNLIKSIRVVKKPVENPEVKSN